MVYLITYDLNRPGQNYDGLYKAIKKLGAWWHYLDSTWLVDTNLSSDQIYARIKPHVDDNDHFLIIKVTRDYTGWLPKKAWEWIKQRVGAALAA